jgi:hypothetical protein
LTQEGYGLEVVNDSPGTVLVKPEDGPWGSLPPGRTCKGKCDGVIGPNGDRIAVKGKSYLPDNLIVVYPDGRPRCNGGFCKWPGVGEKPWPADDPTWTPPATPPELPNVPNKK